MTSRYDHLSKEDLLRLLERRDAMQRYGLVWEREGIEQDRARNQDYVVLDLQPSLSTPPPMSRDGGTWLSKATIGTPFVRYG
jgi:adenine-specific DNA-methyltransferase